MRASWFSRFTFQLFGRRPSRKPPQKRPTRRPAIEALEGRIVPALNWSAGVALPAARAGDAAVLYSDQSVLAVGGATTVNQLAFTGAAWGAADAIDQARVSPGVASIGGGALLVYGGTAGGTALGTALQYDPVNIGNVHAVAAMSTPRSLLAFAADGSNRAYAVGGLDAGGNRLASVERFDPTTGAWSLVAPLPQARSGAAAVYDVAGGVLVFGGATSSGSRTNSVLKYTAATNTWTTLASMPSSTTEAAAVLGPDGLIYVLGGKGSEGALTTVQAYNPATNKWSTAASLPTGVSDEAAVVDGQKRIEVIGGKNSSGYAVSAVYVTQSLASFAPRILTGALPSATAGAAYTATITAVGNPAPTFAVLSGGPTGLSINPTTGVINWTPTAAQLGAQSVTIQVQNAAGVAQQTFALTVTPDTTPPTVPVLSMAAPASTSSLTVNWAPATDNVGVAGYRLYAYTAPYTTGHSGRGSTITYHPATYTLVVALPASATSYTVTGLAPNTNHQYVAAALDAAGNQSAYSNVASGTTLQAPSITYYTGSLVNPSLSVVANHQLNFTLSTGGNPAPTLSLLSAPAGVVFNPGQVTNSQLTFVVPNITWTPTADEVGPNHIVMQATNSVGTYTLDIPVTVTADLPVPSLTVDGGLAYTLGNFTTVGPNAYQVALNPGFDISGGSHPQYALAGTPFTFQLAGVTNTNPTTYALVSGPSTVSLDPNTGVGTWLPGASDANTATSVTASATNSAGTTYLTFTFPTYFTNGPGNVAVGFYTSVSGSAPATWTPVVTWTPPADAADVVDYKVTVSDLNKNTSTVYDVGSSATSFTLPAGIPDQNSVSVTAYNGGGGPSQVSTNVASLYLSAIRSVSWSFSTPTVIAGAPLSVQFAGGATPYAVVSGPSGAAIDPNTGLLTWTPTLADVGTANLVVSSGDNGWGKVYVTLNFPVYFTGATTALSVASNTDPSTSLTTTTVSWNAPTQNTGAIVAYQVSVVPVESPAGTAPTTFTVPADTLTFVLSDYGIYDGTVQIAALDAAGDLGAPSVWVTF